MSVLEWLHTFGGVASRATLVRLTSRSEVDRVVASGDVVRDARGRYALPAADNGLRLAHALSGVLPHRSAAAWWQWELKVAPDRPDVTVAKNRTIDPARLTGVNLHRANLHPDEVAGVATSRERTLVDCLRTRPFDEALAIADSALRSGFSPSAMTVVAATVRGRGAPAIRRAIREARAEAANPFESVLRALALDTGLHVRPQFWLREGDLQVRPDLVDPDLGLVLEADSFSWHGNRTALRNDARRYDLLVVHGYLVLRFAWEDVMHDQDFVRAMLRGIAVLAHRRTQVPWAAPRAA